METCELYSWVPVDRLKALDRGTLSAQKDSVTGLNFAECWGLINRINRDSHLLSVDREARRR